MAKNMDRDLYEKMVRLTHVGVWVGILGLLTAMILGYLQLRAGNQPQTSTKETKTVIYVRDSAGSRVTQEIKGTASDAAHRGVTSGTKSSSETTSATTKPVEPKSQPALTTSLPIPIPSWIKIDPPPSGSSTSTGATPTKPLKHGDRKDHTRTKP